MKIIAPITVAVEPMPLYTTPPAQPAPVQKPKKGSYEAVFGHLDMTPDELGNYMIELQQKAAPPAPVVQPTQEQIVAGAKALNKYTAMVCGVDKDDQWKVYGEELIKDATTVLTAAFNLKG
jgi:hypothetical protein